MKYDNKYFIDKFEIDLCQQMTTRGIEVLMYHGSVLYQNLGERNGHRHPNHSALRHYYLFRNRFYFNRKWFTNIKCIVLDVLQTLKHIGLILLFEDEKMYKIQFLKKAIKDYKKGNMGKYED